MATAETDGRILRAQAAWRVRVRAAHVYELARSRSSRSPLTKPFECRDQRWLASGVAHRSPNGRNAARRRRPGGRPERRGSLGRGHARSRCGGGRGGYRSDRRPSHACSSSGCSTTHSRVPGSSPAIARPRGDGRSARIWPQGVAARPRPVLEERREAAAGSHRTTGRWRTPTRPPRNVCWHAMLAASRVATARGATRVRVARPQRVRSRGVPHGRAQGSSADATDEPPEEDERGRNVAARWRVG
jgi:hypothetical protein